jgi:hypothetical protein
MLETNMYIQKPPSEPNIDGINFNVSQTRLAYLKVKLWYNIKNLHVSYVQF